MAASRTIRARSSSSRQSVDSRIAISLPQTMVSAGAQGSKSMKNRLTSCQLRIAARRAGDGADVQRRARARAGSTCQSAGAAEAGEDGSETGPEETGREGEADGDESDGGAAGR